MATKRVRSRRRGKSDDDSKPNDVCFADDPQVVAQVTELIDRELMTFSSEALLEAHYLSHLPPVPASRHTPTPAPAASSPAASSTSLSALGCQFINNVVQLENLQLGLRYGEQRRQQERQQLVAEADRLQSSIDVKLTALQAKRLPEITLEELCSETAATTAELD